MLLNCFFTFYSAFYKVGREKREFSRHRLAEIKIILTNPLGSIQTHKCRVYSQTLPQCATKVS